MPWEYYWKILELIHKLNNYSNILIKHGWIIQQTILSQVLTLNIQLLQTDSQISGLFKKLLCRIAITALKSFAVPQLKRLENCKIPLIGDVHGRPKSIPIVYQAIQKMPIKPVSFGSSAFWRSFTGPCPEERSEWKRHGHRRGIGSETFKQECFM